MSESTMSTFELIHRPALGAVTPLVSTSIRLTPLPEGAVLLAIGAPDMIDHIADLAAKSGLSLRADGPGQWYLVGDEAMSPAAVKALAEGLGTGVTVIDQSHGRIRIAVEGPVVEDMLARGTGVDLGHFAVGRATSTLIGHIPAHVTRLSEERFDVMPMRGFAESLWHDFEAMAAEYSDQDPD